MASVKSRFKQQIKSTLCSVPSAGLDVDQMSPVQGSARGNPNTPTVAASLPGHHSWAGWAGVNRIFS